jgi:hypothetical protein
MTDDHREHREHLEALVDHIDTHAPGDDPRAQELRAQVRQAIETGEHESVRDRLMEDAIGFEADHPDLAAVIRRAAQLLGAAGL